MREKPTAEDVRQWLCEGHGNAEAKARAKQKGIWQSDLNEGAVEIITKEFGAIYDDMKTELETAAGLLNDSESKRFALMARVRELEAQQ